MRVLNEFAEEHEDALVAGAAGLRHVVRDDDDGVAAGERPHEFLNGFGAVHVERAARLVHEDDARLEREEARDAELLLLLELEADGAGVEAILEIIPEADLGSCPILKPAAIPGRWPRVSDWSHARPLETKAGAACAYREKSFRR